MFRSRKGFFSKKFLALFMVITTVVMYGCGELNSVQAYPLRRDNNGVLKPTPPEN